MNHPSQPGRHRLLAALLRGGITCLAVPLSAQPVITNQPASLAVAAGDDGSLSVAADGALPLGYQWHFNGVSLPHATNSSFLLSNIQTFHAGSYHVVVTNGSGAVTSSVATLTVSLAPRVLWARSAGGVDNYDFANGVAADAAGNVYIAGEFTGVATFGTNTLTAAGNPGRSDMFLAKYARDGDLIWVRQVGSVYGDGASAVTVDDAGNVFVTGWFATNVWFDTILVNNFNPSSVWSDIFIAKYDPDGNALWARNAGGGADYDYAGCIELLANGDPMLTGYFRGTGRFGGQTFGGYGDEEFFVAQYSRDSGSVVTAHFGSSTGGSGSNAGYDRGYAIAVDDAGRRYVLGKFAGTSLNFFNGFQLSAPYFPYTPFLVRFSAFGPMEWAQLHTNGPSISGMTGAGADGFYVCGDQFKLARMDPSGGMVWSAGADGTANNSTAQSIATDSLDQPVVAGAFFGTHLTFPGITLTNDITTNQCVIAGYHTNGTFRWARSFGGTGVARDVGVDAADRVYVAGYFSGVADFGPDTLTAAGGRDAFVARLGVLPPVLEELPAAQAVFSGESGVFTVRATGEPPLTYQWRFQGLNLPGATNGSLVVAGAQMADAGAYSVRVSNAFGVAVSPGAVLTVVTSAPAILVQPQSKTVLGGTTNGFSVLATNSLPFTYQWQFQGTNLPGATAASLTLANIQAAHRGDYRVWVSNDYGSVLSATATLSVNVPATITLQPASQVALAGSLVSFDVVAMGDGDLSYQWRFNGGVIVGATNASLELVDVQLAQQGNYVVVVSNDFGVATSTAATLVVNAPPTIITSPEGRTRPAGSNVTFHVMAAGSPTLQYQWHLEDVRLDGETQSNLTLVNLQAEDSGAYTVVVTNDFGSLTSSPAMLTVIPSAPVILTQPESFSIALGATQSIALTVVAAGSEPLAYQWIKDASVLPAGVSASLVLSNLQPVDAGDYQVVVNNAYGAVTSTVAVVSVSVEPDFIWARRGGGASNDMALATVVDSSGNVYVAGCFTDTAEFNGIPLVSNGGEDIFVAKYHVSGTLLGLNQFGGPGNDRATALALVPAGGLAMGGTFDGPLAIGGTTLTNAGGTDVFLARLDPAGNAIWALHGGGPNDDTAASVSVNAFGTRFYVGGSFRTNATFGTTSFNDPSTSNKMFVAQYNGSGDFVWAVSSGGAFAPTQARALVSDADNLVYVAGTFTGTALFGGLSLSSTGALDVFVARLASGNGAVSWAKRFGTATNTPPLNDDVTGIALGPGGSIVVAGSFQGEMQVSASNTIISFNPAQPDGYLMTLDSGGNTQWVKALNGPGPGSVNAVTVDAFGNTWVTGSFSNQATLGGVTLTGAGNQDMFAALFDSTGTLVKARRAGGAAEDVGRSVATEGEGNLFVTGFHSAPAVFGSNVVETAGARDGFVTRLQLIPPESAPIITTPPRSQSVAGGGNATLTVGAVSSRPLTYQWRRFGTNIAGATANAYTLVNAQLSTMGDYSARVQNSVGTVTSAVATVALEAPPEYLWLQRSGGTGDDQALAVAVDGTNAVYVAGLFSGTNPSFTNLTSAGGTDIFLAKYDGDGSLLWVRRAGGTGADVARAVRVDSAGNVILAGYFHSFTATFGNVIVTNKNTFSDLFLAKYDANGNVLWVRTAGGFANDQATALCLDNTGDAYLTGSFHSGTLFGNFGLTNLNSTNFFVAKYDTGGNVLWVRTTSGTNFSSGTGIAADDDTNIYVTGFLFGSLKLGGSMITNTNGTSTFGNATVFVAKYDREGNLRWTRRTPGSGGYGQGIVADERGDVYAASYRRSYGEGVGLTKYDSAGGVLWYRTMAIHCCTGDFISMAALALDPFGNPLIAGYGNGRIEGITDQFTGGFVLKYRQDGSGFWILQCASQAATGTGAAAMAVDSAGDAIIAGRFTGSSFFGPVHSHKGSSLVSAGGNDAFLVKLGLRPPDLAAQPADQLVISGSNTVLQVTATSSPVLYQWRFNGTNLTGATNASLSLPGFSAGQAGGYSVVVQGAGGATTSAVAGVALIPVLGMGQLGNAAWLDWDGEFTLQSAANVAGPYVDEFTGEGPVTNSFSPDETQRYFRLRVPSLRLRGEISGEAYALTVAGTPGRRYVVETSTNLLHWTATSTNVFPFSVLEPVAMPQKFHRARLWAQ